MNRFSSRRQRLGREFLAERLRGARRYDRIAGYFRSSILELVGEELAQVERVRVVCNSDLDPADLMASQTRDESLLARWNRLDPGLESVLHRERYQWLAELLQQGNVEIRVIPADRVFLHGKAGVIEGADGRRTSFVGSVNETRSAFADNYEIVWEDDSPEACDWVQAEFDELWKDGIPLPQCIVREIRRLAERTEVTLEDLQPEDVAPAALIETPLYRGGQQLQPWQKAFVTIFLDHRRRYGKARLLLADEVGLGKTLSMAVCGIVASLLEDGPTLIVCPATLTLQWQNELWERLGTTSYVWHSTRKIWLEPEGREVGRRGAGEILRCPGQIGIVSNGLIFQMSEEREQLLRGGFGTLVVDEAHKARRRATIGKREDPNNLLAFLLEAAPRCRHVLLGTATPMQTSPADVFDLLEALNAGAEHVAGRPPGTLWLKPDEALPIVTGKQHVDSEDLAWRLLSNPLPHRDEGDPDNVFRTIRNRQRLRDDEFVLSHGYTQLDAVSTLQLRKTLHNDFFRRNNPLVRHIVLRRRSDLEERGLLPRVGIELHPAEGRRYPGIPLSGRALSTSHAFDVAYQAAEEYARLRHEASGQGGFIRTLFLQRICSSIEAARQTAMRLLGEDAPLEAWAEDGDLTNGGQAAPLSAPERRQLELVLSSLNEAGEDPKLQAVRRFLTDAETVQGAPWLELGCIVFSQYYDTAHWLASRLGEELGDSPVALYAGGGMSGVWRNGQFSHTSRDAIKQAVQDREVRLVVATDAACEGLNLQKLGTMINVDLPWNPARLQQRIGRIKRIGQQRAEVDVLHLVYAGTIDERVHGVLSSRLQENYDLFGSLPDILEDDWIEDEQSLQRELERFVNLRREMENAFDARYGRTLTADDERWEECAKVLSRTEFQRALGTPWRG